MDNRQILLKYLPENSVDDVLRLMKKYKIQFRIEKQRTSKYGDYRPPGRVSGNHRISVNHNLNKYHFMLTFYHEIAHLLVWEKYKNRVDSHGVEWQNYFRKLMSNKLTTNYFPEELLPILKEYFYNGRLKASTSSLIKSLREYDEGEKELLLEEIPEGSIFVLRNGMSFKKGKKLRTRYQCTEIETQREYRVNGLAEVRILK